MQRPARASQRQRFPSPSSERSSSFVLASIGPFGTFNQLVYYHVADDKVNTMVERSAILDRTYAALSDPTRRALLVALRRGDARISDLAEPLPMTFAGVSRHVAVLESAGLIRREVRGREHWLSIHPEGLRDAERWIAEQTAFWSERADALAARLERTRRR
jgi:DNA-binding transcriptional ArsR family regulator